MRSRRAPRLDRAADRLQRGGVPRLCARGIEKAAANANGDARHDAQNGAALTYSTGHSGRSLRLRPVPWCGRLRTDGAALAKSHGHDRIEVHLASAALLARRLRRN